MNIPTEHAVVGGVVVAGAYILNHNKIVTINPTDLATCGVAQKAIATNKLWTLV